MKLSHLKPFKEPPPPERESCAACKTFAPECLVPVDDEAVPMCWLCAHHVIEHAAPIAGAHCAECECTPEDIYPYRVGAIVLPKQTEPPSARELQRESLLKLSPRQLALWLREAHKQMSDAQIAAVQKRVAKA